MKRLDSDTPQAGFWWGLLGRTPTGGKLQMLRCSTISVRFLKKPPSRKRSVAILCGIQIWSRRGDSNP